MKDIIKQGGFKEGQLTVVVAPNTSSIPKSLFFPDPRDFKKPVFFSLELSWTLEEFLKRHPNHE
tara:strand:- start:975 stop:1166 length:192 start_codon:yes stop_codon:yes gene_type:complete